MQPKLQAVAGRRTHMRQAATKRIKLMAVTPRWDLILRGFVIAAGEPFQFLIMQITQTGMRNSWPAPNWSSAARLEAGGSWRETSMVPPAIRNNHRGPSLHR